MLGHYKRVLVIGAHPDDEDTELLTILVRGEGAEAAYLSLNRGEGGQNLIGSELGVALGILRTEELLAARRLDGAGQYFTRAYDFGFSKTLDETWAHWPRDTILKDVVRIVRRFRPQIIVSIFSGTPRDGHGQHQAAAWAAMEAFRVAGDSTAFPGAPAGGGPGAVGAAQAVPERALRHDRHDADARRRRARSGGGQDPPPDRHGGPQPAPVAGHGAAAAHRPERRAPGPAAGCHGPGEVRALVGSGHDTRCSTHVGGRDEDAGVPAAHRQLSREARPIRCWCDACSVRRSLSPGAAHRGQGTPCRFRTSCGTSGSMAGRNRDAVRRRSGAAHAAPGTRSTWPSRRSGCRWNRLRPPFRSSALAKGYLAASDGARLGGGRTGLGGAMPVASRLTGPPLTSRIPARLRPPATSTTGLRRRREDSARGAKSFAGSGRRHCRPRVDLAGGTSAGTTRPAGGSRPGQVVPRVDVKLSPG